MATTKEHFAHVLQHGLARTNRFQVLIELPQKLREQAASEPEQDKSKFAEAVSKVVKVVKIFTGGSTEITRGLDVMVGQTEMPGKTINMDEVRYNGDTYKMGNGILYAQQQFTFKVSRDYHEKNIIDEWMKLIVDPKTHEVGYYNDYISRITVHQLDERDQITHSVTLVDAFPVMMNPLTLSNLEQNNVHELMVQFAYKKWLNVDASDQDDGTLSSLSQTPLGPYLTPILSNPVVQRGLDYFENATGIDLEGEALNIYKQMDDIVKSTTGESINKTVSMLSSIRASIEHNDSITPTQAAQLLDLLEGTVDKLKL